MKILAEKDELDLLRIGLKYAEYLPVMPENIRKLIEGRVGV